MSASTLTVCLLQLDIAWENPESNIRTIDSLLESADASSADLVILPEMWSTGFVMQPAKAAREDQGRALQWMKEAAARHNTFMAGSLSIVENGSYYNRFYGAGPDGSLVRYDKKHLFSFGGEDRQYSPGNQRMVYEINGWKIMPVICYDLRFPAWCRNTRDLDYDLLLVVANWPTPRIHHWDTLLPARAIENQCYVAAVNRIGADANGLQYNGHSTVCDMNGKTLLLLGEDRPVGRVTLDYTTLTSFRAQYPFLQDRDRFDF